MKKFLFVTIALTLIATSSFAGEVKTERINASGDSIWTDIPTDLYAIDYASKTNTGGTITLQNRDNSGDTLLQIETADVSESRLITVPKAGINFDSGVWVEFSNVDSVTVFARDRTP